MIIENINVEQGSDILYKAVLVMAYPMQQAEIKIVLIITHLLSIDKQHVFIM